ncbi:S8 family peptidase [Erythrobacter crassostreae]|uniref:S8 family serine peptidase n=1 Tax=Erythrobacter crassostreae TaxID=2828328 RepID=A0A9X1JQ25_9SPHN|nr:S8 family serine peptidase [Erythrobacter crassostrea]MBV7260017.1 S8 family serine peptidase [Erythrobacter crassostrea]
MKSLSISTATAAVAISLASSANAKEAQPYVLPITDGLLTIETGAVPLSTGAGDTISIEVLELPRSTAGGDSETSDVAAASEVLPTVPSEGLVTLPSLREPDDFEFSPISSTAPVVTTRGIDARYGDIDAFWGDIVAFYGDIDAFWGDISPFYGDIDAFWGDISPFYGDIDAFWGDIDAFYGDIDAFDKSDLAAFGDFWQTSRSQISATEQTWSNLEYTTSSTGAVSINYDGTPNRILSSLEVLIAQGEAQFGAAYQTKTGKNFRDGFVAEILARHGLDLTDSSAAKTTLAKSAAERSAFFLDWHDSLNQYSGFDQVDHWMAQINWTPSITQIQGEGRQAVVGIIDGSFSNDADLGNNIAWAGGYDNPVGGHGAGVASLIAGAHDGEGIMGIAPEAKIATYNPFNPNGTTSWADVERGINELLFAYVGGNETGYVSVVNLSLGESGWALAQGMADVLNSPTIARYNHETTYVIAAGNEGVAQTADIDWNYAFDTTFILVGSVDPSGQVSNFSNRPGSACLLNGGVCEAGNELYLRTVVAPGSLILVSDGQGGVTRHSGTSFAAPLVSGAITLLHDRWQWLARNPEETAEIIFRSAQDLGAPGPDEVYGWGLLDVAASQSPLDFNNLEINLNRGGIFNAPVKLMASDLLASGVPSWWETEGVFLTAFENVGNTYRDFTIPMSSFTYGTSTDVLGHGWQRMQDFVSDRFANWLLSGGTDTDGDGQHGINQVRSNTTQANGQWSMRVDAIAPRFMEDGAARPVHNAATLNNPAGNMSFTLGHGQGALALAGKNFGIMSDHDQDTGGVNPVLGFASGEVFAGATYAPAKATTLSVGYTQNRQDWRDLDGVSEIERNVQRQLGARDAEALTIGVEQKVTKNLSVNAQYTYLREDDAVLGAQTTVDAFLGEGSRTNAMTVSATMNLGNGFSFDLSATGGATKAASGQLLATSNDVMSTAGQFTVNKRGVMGDRDILRVSVGQPLTVERGELELTSEEVIDRISGERGLVTQTIGIDTKRRYTGEIVYATPVTKTSELGLIGRYISAGEIGQDESFMLGANFGLRF